MHFSKDIFDIISKFSFEALNILIVLSSEHVNKKSFSLYFNQSRHVTAYLCSFICLINLFYNISSLSKFNFIFHIFNDWSSLHVIIYKYSLFISWTKKDQTSLFIDKEPKSRLVFSF